VSFDLSGLQSYEVVLKWKVYLYNVGVGSAEVSYSLSFRNSGNNITRQFSTSLASSCSSSLVFVDSNSSTLSGVILDSNTLSLSAPALPSAQLGLSELLVVAYRCGGIQGKQCLECSSTSVCTKCLNPTYYISGHTCLQSCPSTYLVRVATRTCLAACPQGTFSDYVALQCLECSSPCSACSSASVCLSCLSGFYLSGSACLSVCPAGSYPDDMLLSCQACLRPCLTCLSNLQCLSCIYGFFSNLSKTCVLSCGSGSFGNISSLSC
jgi:hypothetical protein